MLSLSIKSSLTHWRSLTRFDQISSLLNIIIVCNDTYISKDVVKLSISVTNRACRETVEG